MPLSTSNRPDELLRRLADLDTKFPPGLRADRPYSPYELISHGPFPSEGTRLTRIRNPISGGAIDLPEGQTPQMYLAATNTLAEAKARAQANVIRGWNSEQSAREAIATAYGLDPNDTAGMALGDAAQVMQASYHEREGRRAEAKHQRAEYENFAQKTRERTGMQEALQQINPELADAVASVKDPDAASILFRQRMGEMEDERRRVDKERATFEEERKSRELPGALDQLDQMDPVEAARRAPGVLAPFLAPSAIAQLTSRYQEGAQLKAEQTAQQQKDWAKQVDTTTKEITKGVLEPLRKAMSVAVKRGKAPKDTRTPSEVAAGGGAPPEAPFDYDSAVSEQIANIQFALSNMPDAVDVTELLKNLDVPWSDVADARNDPDPESASQQLTRIAQALERGVRAGLSKMSEAPSGG